NSIIDFNEQVWAKNLQSLNIWQNLGRDVDNGWYAMYGARMGTYYLMLKDWDYANVRDFKYLDELWQEISDCTNEDSIRLGEILKYDLGLDIVELNGNQSKFFKNYISQHWHNRGCMIKEIDVIREIRKGNIVVIAPDIDLGPKDSAFVPFFGIQTNTITAISRLAKACGAEVCLMITTLNPDKSKYICKIHKALPNFPSDDPVADTARLNQYFEEEIRQRPAEYYWVHKRFKYRPPGEASLYD
ncbi:MAG: hypothetical protein EBV46_08235, partial [Burkholderiaceae bacterium]|nr:hypothetical protein [Burkholderiaceae bacterium]